MTANHSLPMILDEVEVMSVERISPTYVRVELGSPALADFGVDGPLYDQRIKLVFPNDAGDLPSFAGADESWFGTWLEIPESERGHMRTYTVRDVRGTGVDTRLVVDFVLHLEDGATGPGSTWAARASRWGTGWSRWRRGEARCTAASSSTPAPPSRCCWWPTRPRCRPCAASSRTCQPRLVARRSSRCRSRATCRTPQHPEGVEVVWLPRDGAPLGSRRARGGARPPR